MRGEGLLGNQAIGGGGSWGRTTRMKDEDEVGIEVEGGVEEGDAVEVEDGDEWDTKGGVDDNPSP